MHQYLTRRALKTSEPLFTTVIVYAFDRVFSPTTMRALAQLLRRSPFRVFASFRSPGEWWACGLTTIHPIAKLRVTTTGKEGMSITIYANLSLAPPARAAWVPAA